MPSAQPRVLITGAGSGLGLALAQRYAATGHAVLCADIDLDRARAAATALPGGGHAALAVDVGDDASFAAFTDAALRDFGVPDVLVNNAGVASGGSLLDADMAEWRRVLEINLLGVVRGCRAFLPAMLQAGRGQVINVASFAGLAGAPNIMSYGVSKAAVVALSEQLRAELHGSGVAVSVVCPAFFPTNLLQNWHGSERMRGAAHRMMASSVDTVDSVADAVFAAAARGTFLILPTRHEPMRWRLKRWLPGLYHRLLLRLAARRAAPTRS